MKPKTKKHLKRKYKLIISEKYFLYCLVAIAFFLFYVVISFKNDNVNKFKATTISSKLNFSVGKSKKILYNTTPTPTIAPTDTPLTGFCLHVPVLMYHHIQPYEVAKTLGQTALTVDSAIFDTQMQYLSQNGYTTLFANDFINALIRKQQLPAKSVVITIDDGYEDNYIYALPILQKYQIKANIMIATGLMGNSNMLSWDQVKSLKNSGLVYFSNHTWSHYAINHGSQDKIESEISTAQKQIQDNLGYVTNVFTYPYGALSDNAASTLKKLGIAGAFSEIPGTTQCDSFLLTLHRTRIGNSPLSYYGL